MDGYLPNMWMAYRSICLTIQVGMGGGREVPMVLPILEFRSLAHLEAIRRYAAMNSGPRKLDPKDIAVDSK